MRAAPSRRPASGYGATTRSRGGVRVLVSCPTRQTGWVAPLRRNWARLPATPQIQCDFWGLWAGRAQFRPRGATHRVCRVGQLTNTLAPPLDRGDAPYQLAGRLGEPAPVACNPPAARDPGSHIYWTVYPGSTLEYPIEVSRHGARGRPREQTSA